MIIALGAFLLFSGCSESVEEEELSALVSQTSYELRDLQNKEYKVIKAGRDFTLEGLEDKVILFDIFATWCPPCRASAPNVASLQEKYIKDVKVIGILVEEEKTNAYVQRFVDSYGANYTISNAEDNRRLSRAIASTTGIGQGFPIPLMVMYYKGKYITHYTGMVPEEMIESDIRRVLGK